jgi:hypothetical protein
MPFGIHFLIKLGKDISSPPPKKSGTSNNTNVEEKNPYNQPINSVNNNNSQTKTR